MPHAEFGVGEAFKVSSTGYLNGKDIQGFETKVSNLTVAERTNRRLGIVYTECAAIVLDVLRNKSHLTLSARTEEEVESDVYDNEVNVNVYTREAGWLLFVDQNEGVTTEVNNLPRFPFFRPKNRQVSDGIKHWEITKDNRLLLGTAV